MNIEEAKKLAGSILEKASVESVYYVDDFLSYDGLKSITKYIEESSVEELERFSEAIIPEAIISAAEAGVDCTEQIEDWWRSIGQENQQRIIEHIGEVSHAESQIKTIFGDKCVLCSPESWLSKYSKECLDKITEGGKVLLLFDLKIGDKGTMGGDGRDGLKLAQSFSVNDGVKEKSYCGLFSQQFTELEEFGYRKKFLKGSESWAFPISKKRIQDNDDYSSFIEGLNNIVWVKAVDSITDVAKRIIEDASKSLKDNFEDILPQDFKQIVINSSSIEGCREIDTLLRLVHIIFNRELQRSMAESPQDIKSINTKVGFIKDIDSITEEALRHQFDSNKVNSFFQDENFIPGEIVNKLLSPLQNGDVFKINKKYYVLLCQPCNISLRPGGKRGCNNYDIGYFVPLHESKKEDKLEAELNKLLSIKEEDMAPAKNDYINSIRKLLSDAAKSYHYKLKCTINDKPMYVAVNEYKTISLSLLDYCTFTESGDLIVNVECSEHLHDNQRLLCEHHNKTLQEQINIEHLLDGISDDVKAIVKPKVESWYYSLLTKLGIHPEFKNSQYVFPIKRYGHIQDPLAFDLLTQLSHYISRAALPSEFER